MIKNLTVTDNNLKGQLLELSQDNLLELDDNSKSQNVSAGNEEEFLLQMEELN